MLAFTANGSHGFLDTPQRISPLKPTLNLALKLTSKLTLPPPPAPLDQLLIQG
jgi:hypothetical protein